VVTNETSGSGALAAGQAPAAGSGGFRMSFTLIHLRSALARLSSLRELEREHAGEAFGNFWNEIAQDASAGMMATAAFLESYVNQIFADRQISFPGKDPALLDELWRVYERHHVLDKFRLALSLRANTNLQLGSRPGQDVKALVDLRNAVIHFTPEWSNEADVHHDVSEVLKHKFPVSPYFPGESIFPRAWIGASCLEWAIKYAVLFVREFQKQANLDDRLEPLRAELSNAVGV
jgi:hypothetical protein